MAKKNKEDGIDRFVNGMERFADKMSDWAEKFGDKMSEKFGEDGNFSYNKSEINQDGKKIVVLTKNKTTIITVNGKEVYKETK